MAKVTRIRNETLEEDFNGDLQKYAEWAARPRPPNVEDDPHHPWHERVRLEKLAVDLPDDCILAREYTSLYTRAEICEMFRISDSGLGKMKVPPRGKSGRYSLYAPSDIFSYIAARAWIQGYREAHGQMPTENIHQIAAMRLAERQNAEGPIKYWTPPAQDEQKSNQPGLFG